MHLFPRLAYPDTAVALRVDDAVCSYRQLAGAALDQAKMLRAAGVKEGDRVALWARSSLQTVAALLGCAEVGAVVVPLNPKLGAAELAHVVGDAAPVLTLEPNELQFSQTATGSLSIETSERPLFVIYTSGTTGPPKGAVLTARNVATNLDALAAAWRWSADDAVVHALPWFHVHGLILGLLGSLRMGGALQHLGRFEAAAVAAELSRPVREHAVLFAVPTMYSRFVKAAREDGSVITGLSAARLLVSGSAGLATKVHRQIESLAGRGVHERYGLSETLINTAVRADSPARPGYVGPPLEGVQLALVDDARRVLDVYDDETMGEVAVRGPSVFTGYLNRPEATAEVMDEAGWFFTGDLATRTQNGALRIAGRRSVDLIKTGGFKVGAGEIEACLLDCVGVAEVAVVGLPDSDLGERIVAFVVPDEAERPPDPQALIQHVHDQLTSHKRPRAIRFVGALPRNALGKVQKRKLQEIG